MRPGSLPPRVCRFDGRRCGCAGTSQVVAVEPAAPRTGPAWSVSPTGSSFPTSTHHQISYGATPAGVAPYTPVGAHSASSTSRRRGVYRREVRWINRISLRGEFRKEAFFGPSNPKKKISILETSRQIRRLKQLSTAKSRLGRIHGQ